MVIKNGGKVAIFDVNEYLARQTASELGRNAAPFVANVTGYVMPAQQIIENSYLNGKTIRLDASIRMSPKQPRDYPSARCTCTRTRSRSAGVSTPPGTGSQAWAT